ncbi:carboxymuconolactone decarboxylase family protein [Vibrio chagasii]
MDTKEQHLMKLFAEIAPQFHKVMEDILFGQIWRDESLSTRDRSLITITALVVLNRVEQLPGHLARALSNGLTVKETERNNDSSCFLCRLACNGFCT